MSVLSAQGSSVIALSGFGDFSGCWDFQQQHGSGGSDGMGCASCPVLCRGIWRQESDGALAFGNDPELQVCRARGEGCCLQLCLWGVCWCWDCRRGKPSICVCSAAPLLPLKGGWEFQSPQQVRRQEEVSLLQLCLLPGHPCIPHSLLQHRVTDCCSPGAAPLPQCFPAHLGMGCCLTINNLPDYEGTLADTIVPVKSVCL